MTGSRLRPAFFVGLFLGLLAVALQGVQSEELDAVPPEDLCRPYIEKALKDLGTGSLEQISAEVETDGGESHEEGAPPGSEEQTDGPSSEVTDDGSQEVTEADVSAEGEGEGSKEETADEVAVASDEQVDDETDKASAEDEQADASAGESAEITEDTKEGQSAEVGEEEKDASAEAATESEESKLDEEEAEQKSAEEAQADDKESTETEEAQADDDKSVEAEEGHAEESEDQGEEKEKDEESPSDEVKSEEQDETTEDDGASKDEEEDSGADEGGESKDDQVEGDSAAEAEDEKDESQAKDDEESAAASEEETKVEEDDSKADEGVSKEETEASKEGGEASEEEEADQAETDDSKASKETSAEDNEKEEEDKTEEEASKEEASKEAEKVSAEDGEDSQEKPEEGPEEAGSESKEGEPEESGEDKEAAAESAEDDTKSAEEAEKTEVKSRGRREVGEAPSDEDKQSAEAGEDAESEEETAASEEQEPTPEEDLIQEIEVPEHLRPRDHIDQLLKLDEENEEKERAIQKMADIVLRDLKRLYDNAIQPLEALYKYRDLSNRHFGDPEIFSKPLVLFMGPWSGGKSSIINYLLDIEYKHPSLRTGAEPSPAYFNIIMHSEEEEILDGTQLAADWTFSGLQKFGQGLLDRLRGLKLNNKLLEKVNIVEIPGILEVRKQVQRVFPFNDACQWFIDRADIIFLVYDPSKLDVGPETEAILDQLKGREYQTRIILNKADQVKPEELMRVQGALIWNISPLMSSAEPPVMYSTSLWSLPYEAGAPTRLLYAQERAFLRDLRSAIDKRVEHKIASARRFAVRVRNHAKMVDCYLTTYYNHKTFFGNKKEISDKIIENPQDYHIYEGLSTLTNISRYDLPDPDVYRDFFRLNPLYDFQQLSATCTYFRGCPINRLDVAIAYDLPELVGKYKKSVEAVIHENEASSPLS